MSLKMIAQDLYKTQKEVQRLEQELALASFENKPLIEEKLRQTRKERDYLRRALDGRLGR